LLISCQPDKRFDSGQKEIYTISRSNPVIASGFSILESEHYSVLSIFHPWDTTIKPQVFYLVPQNATPPLGKDTTVIRVPVKSIVCLSASHLSFLDALGQMDKLTGVNNADYVVSKEFQNLVASGKIIEIGIGDRYKLEGLIKLSPDIVMVSPQPGQSFDPLINAGLMVVPNGDYLETHPLGRAEWIKCLGVLLGCEEKAITIFDSIRNEYNNLKNLTAGIEKRPKVLSGNQYGGFWNLPGGRSYEAQFMADAGADFFYAENTTRGSLTLDFETVYTKGFDADFWRILIYDKDEYSYEKLEMEDPRYRDFKAFKDGKVFVCNTFATPYHQKGLLEPQVILADYINIFHPGLLDGHQNVYYHLLQ
jgi:iron complex transport system substrate-binding protein